MIARCFAALVLLAVSVPAEAQIPTPRIRPEPHNFSQYLSDADFERFREGLDAADDEEWDRVRALRLELTDTAARDILLWRIALNDARASFLELDLALSELDNWPRDSFIRSEAQSKIDGSGLTPPFIVSWFEENPPTTGRGRVSFAEALIAVGRNTEGEDLLRETWRSGRLPSAVQSDTYQRHSDLFTEDDHMARIDYLIWSNQRTLARRVLPLLSGNNRDLADARLRLAGRQSGVDRAVNRIPASLSNDPGLVFERARWRRRSGLRDSTLPLLLHLPDSHTDVTALELMWTERKLMILTLIRDQDYDTAYQLARAHGMSSGADFADAEFMAGWLALVHLDRAEESLAHFTRLHANVSTPVSQSRGAYWMARALDALGRPEEAAASYAAAGQHSTAYYGQLALTQLPDASGQLALERDPEPTEDAIVRFEARPLVRAMRLLAEQDEEYYFRLFSYRLDDQLTDPQEAVLLSRLASNYLFLRQSVRAAKAARLRGIILPQSAYPTITLPPQTNVRAQRPEDALVHSIIRQETEFGQHAVSGAGARGMMQLMPATARATARDLGEQYRFNWLTDDLDYNLLLAMHHLAEVVDDYDGSYVIALAAYNAGGHRANRWIRDYGDPRDPDVDPIDWVESIPFSETRNYVQRVVENLQVYRSRLNDDAAVPLLIEDDMLRGTAPVRIIVDPDD
ncbi:lytic transglycosylase domain-containing protein [Maricaulis sp.]|uniref:lytic transglycosylase domain-containing protein n=1 Tax=Maricaulis sp. TaxID=1486257 RepID=UPI002626E701|nr:lytic transglycosylase domain-containing protein [Maricaulis sp.]MDF1769715.1 lytic transglycosylase domain-containing protein [Maricaulis sp.]